MYSIALPPVVTIANPGEVVVKEGEHVEFICLATGIGDGNFKYQWFLNEYPVVGQDAQSLIIDSVSEDDTGGYTCSVLNPYGGIGQSNNTVVLTLAIGSHI